jgi:hypothetical protein
LLRVTGVPRQEERAQTRKERKLAKRARREESAREERVAVARGQAEYAYYYGTGKEGSSSWR